MTNNILTDDVFGKYIYFIHENHENVTFSILHCHTNKHDLNQGYKILINKKYSM